MMSRAARILVNDSFPSSVHGNRPMLYMKGAIVAARAAPYAGPQYFSVPLFVSSFRCDTHSAGACCFSPRLSSTLRRYEVI